MLGQFLYILNFIEESAQKYTNYYNFESILRFLRKNAELHGV